MDLRHLRYLIGVAEHTTFTAAATALRLAQPALSRQIKDLEKELNVELLERGPRAVVLTPAGETVVALGREILHAAADAARHARLADTGLAGRCVVCVGRLPLFSGFGARLISRVHELYSQIDVVIEELSLTRQFDALREGTGDIGIGGSPPSTYQELAFETQMIVPFNSVAISSTHPLAAHTELSLRDLTELPYIKPTDLVSSPGHVALDRELKKRKVVFRQTREVPTVSAALAVIAAGEGWAFVPGEMSGFLRALTIAIPLNDFSVPVPLCRIWRRSDDRPVTHTVLNVLRALEREERGHAEAPIPAARPEVEMDDRALGRVELRHLRYFVEVAEQGSFGRAAERLEMTQPALSRQVRDLEYDVGVTLLRRESRGVTLTLAGASYLEGVRTVLSLVDRVGPEVRRARRGMSGRCVIAAVPTIHAMEILAMTMRERSLRFPHVQIAVEDIASPYQPAAMRAGSIDLAFTHAYLAATDDAEFERRWLADDRLNTALVHPSHPLAGRAELSVRELDDTPFLFIGRNYSPGFHDLVMAQFAAAAARPRIEREFDGLPTVWSLTMQGQGWCLGAESQRTSPPNATVPIPLSDFSLQWGVELLMHREEAREAVLAIASLITDVASDRSAAAKGGSLSRASGDAVRR